MDQVGQIVAECGEGHSRRKESMHNGVLGMTSHGSVLVEAIAANEVGRELVQSLGCQAREVTTLLRAVGATEHLPREMTWLDLGKLALGPVVAV